MPTNNELENLSNKSTIDTYKEQSDDANTLHEQLKKIKEESKEVLEDSSKPIKNQHDIDNPIHDYCS